MGYTHCWEYSRAKTDKEQFPKAVAEIKRLLQTEEVKHIPLCGEADEDKPILDDDQVFLNGVGREKGEDFVVAAFDPEDDFCKTGRKQYDLVVMLCLIAFANNLNNFTFTSDGDFDKEWLPALALYEREIGSIKEDILKEE